MYKLSLLDFSFIFVVSFFSLLTTYPTLFIVFFQSMVLLEIIDWIGKNWYVFLLGLYSKDAMDLGLAEAYWTAADSGNFY